MMPIPVEQIEWFSFSIGVFGIIFGFFSLLFPQKSIQLYQWIMKCFNWRVEPIDWPREFRTTRVLGMLTVILSFLILLALC